MFQLFQLTSNYGNQILWKKHNIFVNFVVPCTSSHLKFYCVGYVEWCVTCVSSYRTSLLLIYAGENSLINYSAPGF